jgi:hypothetical protein
VAYPTDDGVVILPVRGRLCSCANPVHRAAVAEPWTAAQCLRRRGGRACSKRPFCIESSPTTNTACVRPVDASIACPQSSSRDQREDEVERCEEHHAGQRAQEVRPSGVENRRGRQQGADESEAWVDEQTGQSLLDKVDHAEPSTCSSPFARRCWAGVVAVAELLPRDSSAPRAQRYLSY